VSGVGLSGNRHGQRERGHRRGVDDACLRARLPGHGRRSRGLSRKKWSAARIDERIFLHVCRILWKAPRKAAFLMGNRPWLPLMRELSAKLTEGEKARRSAYGSSYDILPCISPSVTAYAVPPLAEARSRRGSDMPLACHSLPRRRSATSSEGGRGFIRLPPTPRPQYFWRVL